jgi:predicted RNA-binding protein associated with RNAse of E/G family
MSAPADRAAAWLELPLGTLLQIVKLAPDGTEAARYPGEVIEAGAPPPWVAVRATWVSREHNLDGLRFVAGDRLHEFFSPAHPFNVFSVFAPDGTLRGWYANVTYPARLDPTTEPFTLTWHDLYLDVVALPDGTTVVRDEEELAEAGLATTDPDLHALILAARDELLARRRDRAFPFHESTRQG